MKNKVVEHAAARAILRSHAFTEEVALLIGNGVNRAADKSAGITWDGLMRILMAEASKYADHPATAKTRLIPLVRRNLITKELPVSYPEAFDLLEANLHGTDGSSGSLNVKQAQQTRVAELIGEMKGGAPHRQLVRWAERNSVPVLTTNYDHCLEDAISGNGCKHFILKTRKVKSDYYPWDRYYAPTRLSDPISEFGIWHIHGDKAIKRSIRAGLDHYMGMVERLRKPKSAIAREALAALAADPSKEPAYHSVPWLRPFFGCKLWIQGLKLEKDEVGLRWLLIQRYLYWRRFRPKEALSSGWYVHGYWRKRDALSEERRIFLENVGIQVIEVFGRKSLYRAVFGEE